ncbi:MAG: hypothetical protein IJS09_04300, partial [Treponema sp.]|nr:hypothetical protein [Treponema sp.]
MAEYRSWRNSERTWLKDVVPLDTPYNIQKVITSSEIEYSENMDGLDYELIMKNKASQLHVENYLYRFY